MYLNVKCDIVMGINKTEKFFLLHKNNPTSQKTFPSFKNEKLKIKDTAATYRTDSY